MQAELAIFSKTDPGLVHHKNEDSSAVVKTADGAVVLVVCDGMGGMGRGDEASASAVATIRQRLISATGHPAARMTEAIVAADREIRRTLCAQGPGMPGSTAVMVFVQGGYAHVSWVGDSRAYWVRGQAVLDRTQDHKLVDELVRAGELSPEEARHSVLGHVVTRALGGRDLREPDVAPAHIHDPWAFESGDVFVVCSDGVCDLVNDDEMPGLVIGRSVEEAADAIVQISLDRGGHDNITVIIGRWEGPTPTSRDTGFHAPPTLDDAPVIAPHEAAYAAAATPLMSPGREEFPGAAELEEDEETDERSPKQAAPEARGAPSTAPPSSYLPVAAAVLAALILFSAVAFFVGPMILGR